MGSAKLLAITAAAGALLLGSPDAHANGRFPESNKVVVSPSDPDFIILRVTFGLVVSHDRGRTWDWVCERSIGFSGVEDPMYAITPNGGVLATTFLGFTVSRDRACSFAYASGELSGRLFVDLAQRPDAPSSVVAFSSAYQGKNDAGSFSFDSQIWETNDEGQTFAALGPRLDGSLYAETIDVAKTDPSRLYVSGVRDAGSPAPRAFVLVSHDKGQTFEESQVALEDTETSIYLAGVDPTNAERLYARTSNAADKPTRLLVSDDAGKTFRTIFRAKGPLRGFALSGDGARVWVGGPLDGLHAASTVDFTFTARSTARIQCLTSTGDGLWACSDEPSGFIAGYSKDDGASFESRLRFCEIRGPLACSEGTSTHTQCSLGGPAEPRTPPWPEQRSFLGCGRPDAGPDAGTAADADLEGGGGCACRASTSEGWQTPATITLLASAVTALVRGRRRRGRAQGCWKQ